MNSVGGWRAATFNAFINDFKIQLKATRMHVFMLTMSNPRVRGFALHLRTMSRFIGA